MKPINRVRKDANPSIADKQARITKAGSAESPTSKLIEQLREVECVHGQRTPEQLDQIATDLQSQVNDLHAVSQFLTENPNAWRDYGTGIQADDRTPSEEIAASSAEQSAIQLAHCERLIRLMLERRDEIIYRLRETAPAGRSPKMRMEFCDDLVHGIRKCGALSVVVRDAIDGNAARDGSTYSENVQCGLIALAADAFADLDGAARRVHKLMFQPTVMAQSAAA